MTGRNEQDGRGRYGKLLGGLEICEVQGRNWSMPVSTGDDCAGYDPEI